MIYNHLFMFEHNKTMRCLKLAPFLGSLVITFPGILACGGDSPVEDSAGTKENHVIRRFSEDQDSLVHNGPVTDLVFAVRYKVYREVWTGGEMHVELTRKGIPVSLLDKEPHFHVKYRNPKWKDNGAHKVQYSIESQLKGHFWGRINPNPDTMEGVTVAIIFPGKQGTLRVTFTPEELLAIREIIDTNRD